MRRWILIGLLGVSVLPIGLIGIALTFHFRQTLYNAAIEQLTDAANLRQTALESWLDQLTVTLVQSATKLPVPIEQLQIDIATYTPTLRTNWVDRIPSGLFTEIMIASNTDRLLFSTNPERVVPPKRTCAFKIICANQFLTDPNTGITTLIVQYPLLDSKGDPSGALIGLADIRPIVTAFTTRAGLGQSGVAYLVGVQGNLLWLGQTLGDQRAINDVQLGTTVQPILQETAGGITGSSAYVMVSFLPRLFAWLIVEYPLSEVDQPIATYPGLLLSVCAGVAIGAVLISRGLSHYARKPIRALQGELRDLRGVLTKAAETDQRRSRTIAGMGHDLRAPINAALNGSGFLLDGLFGQLNPDQTEMVKQIHDSSAHILELVNDLIDISQVEAGQMRLFVTEYDPTPIFDQTVATLNSLILNKPIEVITDFPRQFPKLTGDRRRMLQILLNLVSNAAKFTDSGQITLRVHTYAAHLEVRVEDTGRGVPTEVLPVLFEPFRGVENELSQSHGGTGLGLALSQIFARLHGGDLSHTPNEKQGAVFILRLPLVVKG